MTKRPARGGSLAGHPHAASALLVVLSPHDRINAVANPAPATRAAITRIGLELIWIPRCSALKVAYGQGSCDALMLVDQLYPVEVCALPPSTFDVTDDFMEVP